MQSTKFQLKGCIKPLHIVTYLLLKSPPQKKTHTEKYNIFKNINAPQLGGTMCYSVYYASVGKELESCLTFSKVSRNKKKKLLQYIVKLENIKTVKVY